MTDADEAALRQRVVAVARGWTGTPYHAGGRVKGAGADCLTLLAEVYAEAGLVPRVSIPHYPQDWHLHRDGERYLDGLARYTREIAGEPQPGDIALWKFGRCYSHGAIVVEWPVIIHAYVGRGCQMEDVEMALWLSRGANGQAKRPVRFFSVF